MAVRRGCADRPQAAGYRERTNRALARQLAILVARQKREERIKALGFADRMVAEGKAPG
jgi:hypothetical protein